MYIIINMYYVVYTCIVYILKTMPATIVSSILCSSSSSRYIHCRRRINDTNGFYFRPIIQIEIGIKLGHVQPRCTKLIMAKSSFVVVVPFYWTKPSKNMFHELKLLQWYTIGIGWPTLAGTTCTVQGYARYQFEWLLSSQIRMLTDPKVILLTASRFHCPSGVCRRPPALFNRISNFVSIFVSRAVLSTIKIKHALMGARIMT